MVRSLRRSSPTSSWGRWRVDGLVDGRRLGLSPIFTNGFSFTVGEPLEELVAGAYGAGPGGTGAGGHPDGGI
jgi:hypothetical protein